MIRAMRMSLTLGRTGSINWFSRYADQFSHDGGCTTQHDTGMVEALSCPGMNLEAPSEADYRTFGRVDANPSAADDGDDDGYNDHVWQGVKVLLQ
jgi:hypothetical protein